jgi:hypothetical protein
MFIWAITYVHHKDFKRINLYKNLRIEKIHEFIRVFILLFTESLTICFFWKILFGSDIYQQVIYYSICYLWIIFKLKMSFVFSTDEITDLLVVFLIFFIICFPIVIILAFADKLYEILKNFNSKPIDQFEI